MSLENCHLVGDGELYGAQIKNVDTTKPFGRMVEDYANRKWWKGFCIGYSSAVGGVIIALLVEKYVLKK
jgi:hypothetical protein